MSIRCAVCKDPRIEAINIACLEGQGTQAIAKDYGFSRSVIENHRSGGHPSRELTKMVIEGRNGPLSELHQFFISSKANRIRKLDEWLEMIDRSIRYVPPGTPADAPPITPDAKLLKVGVEIIRTAAQELGEWRPDGGEKAEALGKLAQSIVIHAAVEAKKMDAPEKPTIDCKPLKIKD